METGDNHDFVTHVQAGTMTMADRTAFMNKGRTTRVGAPVDPFERPANSLVAGFIGIPLMNPLSPRGLLVDSEPAVDFTGGRAGTLGAPAERLPINTNAAATKIGEAIVVRIEDLVRVTHLHRNDSCGAAFVERASGDVRGKIASGATVPLAVAPDRFQSFDPAGGERLT